MDLLFVIKSLSGTGGGAERILTVVSSALAQRGHKVTVLSFDRPDSKDFYPVGAGVTRVRLGLGVTTRRSGPLEIVQRIIGLREFAKSRRPDVAVGFMHSSFIPLAMALAGLKIPVIGCERTAYRHYDSRPIDRLLIRATLPLFGCLTANNDAVRQGYPGPISRRMVVVHNPVPSAKKPANPVGGTRKILLTVGGLRPEKDHSTLLRAFARIAPHFPDWRLRIVGDGPLMSALDSEAKSLGIVQSVEFPGTIERVEKEYPRAQLFVLPSLYESFPNGLAEALAHGLPAVGFASCPGTNDLIQSGVNGLLARDGDRATELARSLEELMSGPEQRRSMGAAALESVQAYDLERVTDKWEQLLRSAGRCS